MKKLLIFLFINAFVIHNFAAPQKIPTLLSVTYQNVVNGKVRSDSPGIMLLCSAEASKSWVAKDSTKLIPTIAVETSYIDFSQKKTYQIARFSNGNCINTPTSFSEYPVLTETGETAVILGYSCKKVKTSLRSNSIEIWYTTEPGVKG